MFGGRISAEAAAFLWRFPGSRSVELENRVSLHSGGVKVPRRVSARRGHAQRVRAYLRTKPPARIATAEVHDLGAQEAGEIVSSAEVLGDPLERAQIVSSK